MTVKPIDIQINIAQMHEVAKGEHSRSAANIEGQHKLEQNAEEEARRIRNKLEENKEAEKTIIMREEGRRQKQHKRSNKSGDKNDTEENEDLKKYNNIGLKIDVKR